MARPLTKAWFADSFAGSRAPKKIRDAAEATFRAERLREGTSPVDVANALALELSCGDGEGEFFGDVDTRDGTLRAALGGLLDRYGSRGGLVGADAGLDRLSMLVGASLRGEELTVNNLVIRPLLEEDAPAFIAFIARNRSRFESSGLNNLPIRESDYQRAIVARDEATHIGAFAGADCVGFAGAERVRVGAMSRSAVGVWYGVDGPFCGAGIGKTLARTTLSRFLQREPALEGAVIHCRPGNRLSMKLARSLGFEPDAGADYERFLSGRSVQKMLGFSAPRERILMASPTSGVQTRAGDVEAVCHV